MEWISKLSLSSYHPPLPCDKICNYTNTYTHETTSRTLITNFTVYNTSNLYIVNIKIPKLFYLHFPQPFLPGVWNGMSNIKPLLLKRQTYHHRVHPVSHEQGYGD
jgi:hypothetical protein